MSERSNAFGKWEDFYRQVSESGEGPLWPSETLVRLFKGPYVRDMPRDLRGMKALDMGAGNGNNMLLLCSMGLEVSGTEVNQEICTLTEERMAKMGHQVCMRVGTNRQIPFDTDTFDFLVSWNVVHYEDHSDAVRDAFREYARVLKPGGIVLLSTTGPEHKILTGAERVAPHRYRIGREDDFRKGQIFFYFDEPACLEDHMSPAFRDIQIGRTLDRMLTETLDWYIAAARKA